MSVTTDLLVVAGFFGDLHKNMKRYNITWKDIEADSKHKTIPFSNFLAGIPFFFGQAYEQMGAVVLMMCVGKHRFPSCSKWELQNVISTLSLSTFTPGKMCWTACDINWFRWERMTCQNLQQQKPIKHRHQVCLGITLSLLVPVLPIWNKITLILLLELHFSFAK